MQTCPKCGGRISSTWKDRTETVARCTFSVRMSAFACRRCRETFVFGPMLERGDLEIACAVAMRGAPAGDGFRFMRHVMRLRAGELAALLTVTPETVSRWENGQRAVDPIAWVAVGSILLEQAGRPPKTMERFQALKDGSSLPRTLRIDLAVAPKRKRRGAPPASSSRTLVPLVG